MSKSPFNIINRKKIIELREQTGMNQADVASAIGLWPKFICEMEGSSRVNPSLINAYRLAAFYGVKVEEVINNDSAGIPEIMERKKKQEVVVRNREKMKKIKAPASRLQDKIQAMIRDFEETNNVSLSLSYNKRKKKINTTINIQE